MQLPGAIVFFLQPYFPYLFEIVYISPVSMQGRICETGRFLFWIRGFANPGSYVDEWGEIPFRE